MDKCQGMRSDSMKDGKCYANQVYEQYKIRQNKKVKLTAPDIYYPLRGAVVTIYATTKPVDNDAVTTIGSGFFFASDRILTAASVVLYNGVGSNRDPSTTNSIVKANSYMVRVQNVKSNGKAFFYNAELTFVSPSFDIAVLEVLPPLDKCTPSIDPHPILEWGRSRETAIGETVYTIGDYLNLQTIGINAGTVVDNVYNDTRLGPDDNAPTGYNNNYWGFEAVLTDLQIAPENIGGPLLNSYGRVIGIITGADFYAEAALLSQDPVTSGALAQQNLVRTVALSQHIAEYITKIFLEGPADLCTGGFLELIRDPTGNFYRFVYGYLGINRYETNNPEFMQYVPNLKFREQKGILVLGVEDNTPLGNNTVTGVPGPFQNIWPGAPTMVDASNEMYLITSINGNPIGVAEGQVGITTVTRLHVGGDIVEIHYRLGSEGFGKAHVIQVELIDFPQTMDFPPNFLQSTPIARELDSEKLFNQSIARSFGGPDSHNVLKSLVKEGKSLLDLAKKFADLNHDGKVDVGDLLKLLGKVPEVAPSPDLDKTAPAS